MAKYIVEVDGKGDLLNVKKLVTCGECKQGTETPNAKIFCRLKKCVCDKADFCAYGERREHGSSR